jgi:hypothetical protein
MPFESLSVGALLAATLHARANETTGPSTSASAVCDIAFRAKLPVSEPCVDTNLRLTRSPTIRRISRRLTQAALAVSVAAGFGTAALADSYPSHWINTRTTEKRDWGQTVSDSAQLADTVSVPGLPTGFVPDDLSGLPASYLPDPSSVSYAEGSWIMDGLARCGPVLLPMVIVPTLLLAVIPLTFGLLRSISRRRRLADDVVARLQQISRRSEDFAGLDSNQDGLLVLRQPAVTSVVVVGKRADAFADDPAAIDMTLCDDAIPLLSRRSTSSRWLST